MSVLIVGSTALDSIKTPQAENPRLLGGSASHAAVAASFFSPVQLIGVVGEDFPKKYLALYKKHNIDLTGLQILPGKTFHWSGEYELNMNNRHTLATELGVLATFNPTLPPSYQKARFVLLANIAPAVQQHVLNQITKPAFVVADTMDLWLNIALPDLTKLLKHIHAFVLNDSEAHQLTKEDNVFSALKKIHKMGPQYVIIKKGSHGSLLSSPKGIFICPAYPLTKVVDPTGAGDSFVGGMLGYLATAKGTIDANIRRAMIYGSVTASFCCQGFGLNQTTKTKRSDIDLRLKALEQMTKF
jgi:sugar/nucleoside kinase (ribokinase family)